MENEVIEEKDIECPSSQEVNKLLEPFGFAVVFSSPDDIDIKICQIADLASGKDFCNEVRIACRYTRDYVFVAEFAELKDLFSALVHDIKWFIVLDKVFAAGAIPIEIASRYAVKKFKNPYFESRSLEEMMIKRDLIA